ncbi:MAG: ATP-dependent DNA helicase [Okeania sp. SIO2C2]|uniref:helicase C-terminal domain-containing protein n=1 Tax=Okeania sp. SIO2C2 TaxID=2607787 RepID=UPI0013B695FF|nr:helicase C-terminal domain-containing protein [Okeania sp. SIO2C2]NEP88847.1 ATP-dependent DNA helicase [Okeania sp. SIO2C2]
MIEVEVHRSLRNFLRSQNEPHWPHNLTMARLVARALRLGRSALIQTGSPPGSHNQQYQLSYLVPILMWPQKTILVAPQQVQEHLLRVEIPKLLGNNSYSSSSLPNKPIQTYPQQDSDFNGLLLITPEAWLINQWPDGQFSQGIPTIIDWADNLETWVQNYLTTSFLPADWNQLMQVYSDEADFIREARINLTRSLFQHPANPYSCYLIEQDEEQILQNLIERLSLTPTNKKLHRNHLNNDFWLKWQSDGQLRWAEIHRQRGSFSLYCTPCDLSEALYNIWTQQPVVIIGGALDLEAKASTYRKMMGLEDLTCVKFSPDRRNEMIQLYLPNGLPMPNTPKFQEALIQEIRTLLYLSSNAVDGLIAIVIGDVPLKAQVGAVLASEFGSRVQVETTSPGVQGILITGWEFWQKHQRELKAPKLLIIATLPLPSLENPLVSGRVNFYKQRGLDWFRLYLLPKALQELQSAIASIRESQGVVALLDSRVIRRSYGKQFLVALSPFAKIDYLDTTWLT